MSDSQLQYLKPCQGKSWIMHHWINLAFERHKTVLVLTMDQKGTIARLRHWFPTNLMELCDNGVRIYRRAV